MDQLFGSFVYSNHDFGPTFWSTLEPTIGSFVYSVLDVLFVSFPKSFRWEDCHILPFLVFQISRLKPCQKTCVWTFSQFPQFNRLNQPKQVVNAINEKIPDFLVLCYQ